jgi:hypothetical protein
MIPEDEQVSCITIKANLKSSMYWKKQQAEFLEVFIPIFKGTLQKKK